MNRIAVLVFSCVAGIAHSQEQAQQDAQRAPLASEVLREGPVKTLGQFLLTAHPSVGFVSWVHPSGRSPQAFSRVVPSPVMGRRVRHKQEKRARNNVAAFKAILEAEEDDNSGEEDAEWEEDQEIIWEAAMYEQWTPLDQEELEEYWDDEEFMEVAEVDAYMAGDEGSDDGDDDDDDYDDDDDDGGEPSSVGSITKGLDDDEFADVDFR